MTLLPFVRELAYIDSEYRAKSELQRSTRRGFMFVLIEAVKPRLFRLRFDARPVHVHSCPILLKQSDPSVMRYLTEFPGNAQYILFYLRTFGPRFGLLLYSISHGKFAKFRAPFDSVQTLLRVHCQLCQAQPLINQRSFDPKYWLPFLIDDGACHNENVVKTNRTRRFRGAPCGD